MQGCTKGKAIAQGAVSAKVTRTKSQARPTYSSSTDRSMRNFFFLVDDDVEGVTRADEVPRETNAGGLVEVMVACPDDETASSMALGPPAKSTIPLANSNAPS